MSNSAETISDEVGSSDKPNLLEIELSLVSLAHEQFENEKYDKCLETIQELETNVGGNNKLCHNRAVVTFYKTGCKDYKNLLKELNKLNEGSELVKSRNVIFSEALTRFNIAVIYFHRHMYESAYDILAPVMDKLDSLDEKKVIFFSTLMLNILIASNKLSKAQLLLDVLYKHLDINTNTNPDEHIPTVSLKTVESYGRFFTLLSGLVNVLNRNAISVPEDGSVEFSALKAYQYYIMKDFQMASKQLMKMKLDVSTDSVYNEDLNTCIANNMGVIHLRVRNYAIATRFFQDALSFDKSHSLNLQNLKLHELSTTHSAEILYNLGISMLHLHRPQEAFKCLLVPLKAYHNNPRIWFRIAEACIMNHEMKFSNSTQDLFTYNDSKTNFKTVAKKILYSNQSGCTVLEPSMEFAALSLRNALYLTKYYKTHLYDLPDNSGNIDLNKPKWHTPNDNNFCNPSPIITEQSFNNLLSAIYAACSFVSLQLGDYVVALEMSKSLLDMENLSDAYILLGRMYAAEALSMTEKLNESKKYLDPQFITNLNVFDLETKNWNVKSIDAAMNIVRYNLAIVLAMQGDFESAKNVLSTCNHSILAGKTTSLHLHLDSKLLHSK